MIRPTIRAAEADDLAPLAAFIARLNARPESQSLHCAAVTPSEVRGALRQAETFADGWERSFVVATDDSGEIIAACGCQRDAPGAQGWLWGPWVNDPTAWGMLVPAMLEALRSRLPSSMRRMEAFLNAENRPGLRGLRDAGFSPGALTHLYVAPLAVWPSPGETAEPLPHLRTTHEVGFARLHAETFPANGSVSAADLLAGCDREHVIFAAGDGLRLLGYVCVAVNHAPREGFIEYLAVRPTARGKGIGARLLRAALHWTFEECRLPQAALCVSEWRGGARRLYESTGFRWHASGIAARRSLRT